MICVDEKTLIQALDRTAPTARCWRRPQTTLRPSRSSSEPSLCAKLVASSGEASQSTLVAGTLEFGLRLIPICARIAP